MNCELVLQVFHLHAWHGRQYLRLTEGRDGGFTVKDSVRETQPAGGGGHCSALALLALGGGDTKLRSQHKAGAMQVCNLNLYTLV